MDDGPATAPEASPDERPRQSKAVDWGVALAAIAVLISAGQTWITFEALKEARGATLVHKRIELCIETRKAVEAAIRGTPDFYDDEEAFRRMAGDELAKSKYRSANVQRANDLKRQLELVGPPELHQHVVQMLYAISEWRKEEDSDAKFDLVSRLILDFDYSCMAAVGSLRRAGGEVVSPYGHGAKESLDRMREQIDR